MITIDLKKPQGNAFFLLGQAEQWGKQLGLDTESILADMQSGDYDHLIEVFEKHFGAVSILINKPGEESDLDAEDEGWY